MVVERTFGIFRKKWHVIADIQTMNLETISHIIIACCILHNYLIRTKDINEWKKDLAEANNEPVEAVFDEQSAKDWRNEVISEMFD